MVEGKPARGWIEVRGRGGVGVVVVVVVVGCLSTHHRSWCVWGRVCVWGRIRVEVGEPRSAE
jgi:hypothetical protein